MNIWEVKHKIDRDSMMMEYKDAGSKHMSKFFTSVFFEGKCLSETWVVPEARLNPKQPGATLVNFPFIDYGALLCDSYAWNIIRPYVENEVEALPVVVADQPYHLLNPIQVIDCLDKEKSRFRRSHTGRVTHIDHYVLQIHKLDGMYLFKTPERNRTLIYCTEPFRQLILDHQLTGLEFLPLP